MRAGECLVQTNSTEQNQLEFARLANKADYLARKVRLAQGQLIERDKRQQLRANMYITGTILPYRGPVTDSGFSTARFETFGHVFDAYALTSIETAWVFKVFFKKHQC